MAQRTLLTALATISLVVGLCLLPAGTAARSVVRAPAPAEVVTTRSIFGRSFEDRQLVVVSRGDANARRNVLVVGCIHGNEGAGKPIVRRLMSEELPVNVQIHLVTTINPDGERVGTRQNARGVDLNRNFPYRWQPAGQPWDTFYPGPVRASEPEARAAMQLVRRLKPDVTIWYHQHLDLVARPSGRRRVAVARRYARVAGMRLRTLQRYRGTATSWQNHVFDNSAAFVVELPAGKLGERAVKRHVRAVLAAAVA